MTAPLDARMRPDAAAFAARLAAKARVLAEAHAENARRAARQDAGRWRAARLLWPLLGER